VEREHITALLRDQALDSHLGKALLGQAGRLGVCQTPRHHSVKAVVEDTTHTYGYGTRSGG
jgi:hypothetical protein